MPSMRLADRHHHTAIARAGVGLLTVLLTAAISLSPVFLGQQALSAGAATPADHPMMPAAASALDGPTPHEPHDHAYCLKCIFLLLSGPRATAVPASRAAPERVALGYGSPWVPAAVPTTRFARAPPVADPTG